METYIFTIYLSFLNVTCLDGDQVTLKAAFADETNEELRKHMQSKSHYIDFGCKNIRVSTNEAVQALYSLTLSLPGTELTKNIV